jgi:hypothetical protein
MNYKNFFLSVIFLFCASCATNNQSINKKNYILKKGFANKGFTIVFNQNYYDNGLISKKIDERSLIIFQKNLNINTHVKITNMLNNKSLIAKVGRASNYPAFNNSVISLRIANELDLDTEEPYIELVEIIENSMFIAKKAKTFDEEKNVAKKAPIKKISINNLNKTIKKSNKKIKKDFSYKIKIADFFFKDTAKIMVNRIINDTDVRNPKIEKINEEKYRVFLGPFDNINSLQKSYNDVNILDFENIEITQND